MQIKLIVKTIYGVKKYYPACEISKKLVELTGHKTFTLRNIEALKSVGYKIENVTKVEEI